MQKGEGRRGRRDSVVLRDKKRKLGGGIMRVSTEGSKRGGKGGCRLGGGRLPIGEKPRA